MVVSTQTVVHRDSCRKRGRGREGGREGGRDGGREGGRGISCFVAGSVPMVTDCE